MDLAYLPGSWSARTVDEEFFRRVRSLCYVVSGDDHLKEGVLRPILDALLAGKHQWGTDTQVSPPTSGVCVCPPPNPSSARTRRAQGMEHPRGATSPARWHPSPPGSFVPFAVMARCWGGPGLVLGGSRHGAGGPIMVPGVLVW